MDRQLIAFLDHFGVPRHYPAGSMIFRQGETEDCLYFVREGWLWCRWSLRRGGSVTC